MDAAAPAMPMNPKAPAISATTRKINAHYSMVYTPGRQPRDRPRDMTKSEKESTRKPGVPRHIPVAHQTLDTKIRSIVEQGPFQAAFCIGAG